ncbi:hypothetical protein I4U23_006126 [Adineta vaga]|nr:hypothetical protein I4U23_006126 [Adineta vaga]
MSFPVKYTLELHVYVSQKEFIQRSMFDNKYYNHGLPENRRYIQLNMKNSRTRMIVPLPIKTNKRISSKLDVDLYRCLSTQNISNENEYSKSTFININNTSEKISELIRECAVCLLEQSVDQFHRCYSYQCEHHQRTICDTCLYNHLKSLLENLIDQNKIHCPESNCTALIPFSTIHYIFMSRNNLQLFERYDRQLTHQYLEQNKEFIWCTYNTCSSGQFHDMGIYSNPMMNCIKCKRQTCVYHRTRWHVGMTCKEYDQIKNTTIDDNNTQIWLRKHSKICPKCHSYIEKVSGCDHMTCKRCGHQFCWQCLVDYQNIHRYGLRQHRIDCSHHPTYYRSANNLSSQRSTTCNIF